MARGRRSWTGLKKSCLPTLSRKEKLLLIDKTNNQISLSKQAKLVGISRSSLYYLPKEPLEDFRIMRAIDEIYTQCPFYGSRRIGRDLKDDYDTPICREHAQRLMRLMGIEAIYPKKRTTIPGKEHGVYPYLLRNLPIIRPNQVWGTDITFIRLLGGFCYLVAILDWFSRYVIAWKLSATMDVSFCLETLNQALTIAIPEIHNSDQGSQFTSQEYLALLQAHPQIQISMDGRGRCMDNIFTERLWRTVKYEDVYLKNYQTMQNVETGLTHYFSFYNTKRKHQSLNYKTPYELYFGQPPAKNNALKSFYSHENSFSRYLVH